MLRPARTMKIMKRMFSRCCQRIHAGKPSGVPSGTSLAPGKVRTKSCTAGSVSRPRATRMPTPPSTITAGDQPEDVEPSIATDAQLRRDAVLGGKAAGPVLADAIVPGRIEPVAQLRRQFGQLLGSLIFR